MQHRVDQDDDTPGRSLRVLLVVNAWPTPDHPEYGVFNARQAAELRRLGVTVEVVFVNGRDEGRRAYLHAAPRVIRAARQADLVHCHHGLSLVLARLAGVRKPMVVSFQNPLAHEFEATPQPLRWVLMALTRRWLRSGRIGAVFKDRMPPDLCDQPLVRKIANSVDLDAFAPGNRAQARAALGLDPDAVYLLFVSSKNLHRPQKRYDRFRAMLDRLRALRPDLDLRELLLVNSGEEQVRLSYQAASLHVLTSDFEGSPNSVKEALASGLPVVSTDVGNVRELIDGLPSCRLVSARSGDALAAAVLEALALPGEEAAMRRRLDEGGFAGLAAARQMIALYRDVLAAAGPPQGTESADSGRRVAAGAPAEAHVCAVVSHPGGHVGALADTREPPRPSRAQAGRQRFAVGSALAVPGRDTP